MYIYIYMYIPGSSNICRTITVLSKTVFFDPTAMIFACRLFAHSGINQNCKRAQFAGKPVFFFAWSIWPIDGCVHQRYPAWQAPGLTGLAMPLGPPHTHKKSPIRICILAYNIIRMYTRRVQMCERKNTLRDSSSWNVDKC